MHRMPRKASRDRLTSRPFASVLNGSGPAIGLIVAALVSSAVALAAPAPDGGRPTVAQAACGGPGLPPCPLQAWMRANVAAPLAANNSAALAAGLERAAGLSPDPSFSSWSSIASQGAAAAKKGDIAGARASCKACHDAWREQYKKKYRTRPIPR